MVTEEQTKPDLAEHFDLRPGRGSLGSGWRTWVAVEPLTYGSRNQNWAPAPNRTGRRNISQHRRKHEQKSKAEKQNRAGTPCALSPLHGSLIGYEIHKSLEVDAPWAVNHGREKTKTEWRRLETGNLEQRGNRETTKPGERELAPGVCNRGRKPMRGARTGNSLTGAPRAGEFQRTDRRPVWGSAERAANRCREARDTATKMGGA
jgi:hypothetical protein